MGRTYVAVDLETTGLDPNKDTIIELGAARFRDGEVLDTFSQVVNPGRQVPLNIQQLTGISQEEVDQAPVLAQVASRFREFIGTDPMVGHNIAFDAAFLETHNLFRANPLVDTWELALILLPGLPSYKLTQLAQKLKIPLENAHRAFEDAQATMYVFEALRQQATGLPDTTLQQINAIAANVDWSLKLVFSDALLEAAQQWAARPRQDSRKPVGPLFERQHPLEPVDHPQPLDAEAQAHVLTPDGPFAAHFGNYEYRQPQVDMLLAVTDAFNRSQHVLIEAGTGTGKSLAYLIPALTWAHQTGQRVVVSSNTINLQDQLFFKDVPDLHEILPFEFNVAVMKGRSNYLCPRRLQKLLGRMDLTRVEVSVLARILVWFPNTSSGDVSEISLVNARERSVWQRVCSDSNSCSPGRCVEGASQPCYFYLARNKAEAAHLIIVNHALLLADIAVESNVLPRYGRVIVDEAHHLEDATTRALTQTVDHIGFVARLRDLAPISSQERAVGLLSDVTTAVKNACPADKAESFSVVTRELAAEIPLLDMGMAECLDALDRFLKQHLGHRYENKNYDLNVRITDNERVQPAWVNVEITWDNVAVRLKAFLKGIRKLLGGLADLSNYAIADAEDLEADILSIQRALDEAYQVCESAILTPDAGAIYWVRRSRRTGMLTLNSAPLHVGSLLEQHIFLTKDTVILTSATLRTGAGFEFMQDRLGAEEADTVALDSPFDYKTNALVYLPTDMPEPNQPAYQAKVEESILQLGLATQGRLLALFTSYAQLTRTAEVIRPHLEDAGFTLFVQGQGGSRQQLLEAFRATDEAVLMGTRSFWEGVDVQGEALSALVITRLPFSVPSDPIFSARSETFDSPFFQYSVPEAILHLRQGFGRMIRSKTDRGICVLLDRRLTSKRYGQLFLDSLPDCTMQRGPLSDIPITARRWLQNESIVAAGEVFEGYENYMPEPPPPETWEG